MNIGKLFTAIGLIAFEFIHIISLVCVFVPVIHFLGWTFETIWTDTNLFIDSLFNYYILIFNCFFSECSMGIWSKVFWGGLLGWIIMSVITPGLDFINKSLINNTSN